MAYFSIEYGGKTLQTLHDATVYDARKKAIKFSKARNGAQIFIYRFAGPEYGMHKDKWEQVYISDVYGPMVMTKPAGAENFRTYRLSEKTGKLLDVNSTWKYL